MGKGSDIVKVHTAHDLIAGVGAGNDQRDLISTLEFHICHITADVHLVGGVGGCSIYRIETLAVIDFVKVYAAAAAVIGRRVDEIDGVFCPVGICGICQTVNGQAAGGGLVGGKAEDGIGSFELCSIQIHIHFVGIGTEAQLLTAYKGHVACRIGIAGIVTAFYIGNAAGSQVGVICGMQYQRAVCHMDVGDVLGYQNIVDIDRRIAVIHGEVDAGFLAQNVNKVVELITVGIGGPLTGRGDVVLVIAILINQLFQNIAAAPVAHGGVQTDLTADGIVNRYADVEFTTHIAFLRCADGIPAQRYHAGIPERCQKAVVVMLRRTGKLQRLAAAEGFFVGDIPADLCQLLQGVVDGGCVGIQVIQINGQQRLGFCVLLSAKDKADLFSNSGGIHKICHIDIVTALAGDIHFFQQFALGGIGKVFTVDFRNGIHLHDVCGIIGDLKTQGGGSGGGKILRIEYHIGGIVRTVGLGNNASGGRACGDSLFGNGGEGELCRFLQRLAVCGHDGSRNGYQIALAACQCIRGEIPLGITEAAGPCTGDLGAGLAVGNHDLLGFCFGNGTGEFYSNSGVHRDGNGAVNGITVSKLGRIVLQIVIGKGEQLVIAFYTVGIVNTIAQLVTHSVDAEAHEGDIRYTAAVIYFLINGHEFALILITAIDKHSAEALGDGIVPAANGGEHELAVGGDGCAVLIGQPRLRLRIPDDLVAVFIRNAVLIIDIRRSAVILLHIFVSGFTAVTFQEVGIFQRGGIRVTQTDRRTGFGNADRTDMFLVDLGKTGVGIA